MAEAARQHGQGQAYVALSPGSLSEESIRALDSNGVPWLVITARGDRFLTEIVTALREQGETVELLTIPGSEHATDILVTNPDVAERVAVWLARQLRAH